jgi:hypothetical protein
MNSGTDRIACPTAMRRSTETPTLKSGVSLAVEVAYTAPAMVPDE